MLNNATWLIARIGALVARMEGGSCIRVHVGRGSATEKSLPEKLCQIQHHRQASLHQPTLSCPHIPPIRNPSIKAQSHHSASDPSLREFHMPNRQSILLAVLHRYLLGIITTITHICPPSVATRHQAWTGTPLPHFLTSRHQRDIRILI